MNIEFRGSTILLFLMALAGPAPIAMAQSTGTFTATGSMTTARGGHTATLLQDGRVLIAGGGAIGYAPIASVELYEASAELYDPATGTFTRTGDMTTARGGHTATLLPDGRVLIAGGEGALESALTSAELYDPSMGTFTATGNMAVAPGFFGTATLLGNGKILIAGVGPTAEVYDPATGTFALTGAYAGSYTGPPYVDTATLLPDGRVLVTGCDCGLNVTAPVIELYDPGTGTFSLTGTMSGTVSWWWEDVNRATLLRNGKVLIAGSSDGLPTDAEVYDPSTRTLTGIGHTITTHGYSIATLLPDGTVLIAGGVLPGGNGTPAADLYAPATGMFYAAGSMTMGRHEHTATLLHDGTVLIAGGYNIWPTATSSAELYVPPPSDSWQQAITAMKTAAGTDGANFWQWAWYWQRSPAFSGAPAGFGALGSIDNIPGLIDKIIATGGGDGFQMVSAEQWVLYYRQAVQPPDPWQQAITAMKTAAGTDSANFWQWAWYWQRSPAFSGAPAGFGVLGSIDNTPGLIDKMIAAGGEDGFQVVSAEQWVADYRQAAAQ